MRTILVVWCALVVLAEASVDIEFDRPDGAVVHLHANVPKKLTFKVHGVILGTGDNDPYVVCTVAEQLYSCQNGQDSGQLQNFILQELGLGNHVLEVHLFHADGNDAFFSKATSFTLIAPAPVDSLSIVSPTPAGCVLPCTLEVEVFASSLSVLLVTLNNRTLLYAPEVERLAGSLSIPLDDCVSGSSDLTVEDGFNETRAVSVQFEAHDALASKTYYHNMHGHSFTMHASSLTLEYAHHWVASDMQEDHYGMSNLDLSPGDVIIDIGAHIGFVTVVASLKFPQARILSYEASPPSYSQLSANVNHNAGDNVRIHNRAVIGENQPPIATAEVRFNWRNPGLASCTMSQSDFGRLGPDFAPYFQAFEVPTVTLPEIFASHQVASVALLKLDCEGCEYAVVNDALDNNAEWLTKVKAFAGELHRALAPSPAVAQRVSCYLAAHCVAPCPHFVQECQQASASTCKDCTVT